MTSRGAWRRWFVTLGGSGMSPVAPGTFGSLAATLLLALILYLFRQTHTPLTPPFWNAILVAGILLYGALCVLAMYLGRFIRLNSWDVLVAPGAVVRAVMHIPRPTTVVVLGVMFVVVGVGVFVTLAITDKVLARARRLL